MSNPLSPSALAQVPEVRQALKDCRESSWSQNEPALLLAVRDAVLQAERQRLLGMTPEVREVVTHFGDYDDAPRPDEVDAFVALLPEAR